MRGLQSGYIMWGVYHAKLQVRGIARIVIKGGGGGCHDFPHTKVYALMLVLSCTLFDP